MSTIWSHSRREIPASVCQSVQPVNAKRCLCHTHPCLSHIRNRSGSWHFCNNLIYLQPRNLSEINCSIRFFSPLFKLPSMTIRPGRVEITILVSASTWTILMWTMTTMMTSWRSETSMTSLTVIPSAPVALLPAPLAAPEGRGRCLNQAVLGQPYPAQTRPSGQLQYSALLHYSTVHYVLYSSLSTKKGLLPGCGSGFKIAPILWTHWTVNNIVRHTVLLNTHEYK